jgi:hypothetical protein
MTMDGSEKRPEEEERGFARVVDVVVARSRRSREEEKESELIGLEWLPGMVERNVRGLGVEMEIRGGTVK